MAPLVAGSIRGLTPPARQTETLPDSYQYVGVLRLGKQTIQILPKIYQSGAATDRRCRAEQATRNLLHMLRVAADAPIREQGLASLLRRDTDWFEILTRLFAVHLREEWQRGPCRGYVGVEDDLPLLKGKWRIAEQLRHPARDHKLAVAYDEFTADVPVNRVFRFMVERLWRLSGTRPVTATHGLTGV